MMLVGVSVSLFASPEAKANVFAATIGFLFIIGLAKGILKFNWTLPGMLMDGFVINDTTYAGEAASSFILRALTKNDTVQGGHVYIKDGIKNQFTIPRWDADFEDFVQDRSATPTSKGTMTIDGRVLQPQDYMIYTEFNPRDYEAHWFATQLNSTLIDRDLPVSVESVVVQGVLARHDKYTNKAYWNSSKSNPPSATYKYYDGFVTKASGAPSGNKVASTTLTTNNIQGEMSKCYSAIPVALRYDPAMKFFCSYATYDVYMLSQINQTYKGKDITAEGVPTFRGREVVKIADFPDNTIIVAKGRPDQESNLWVGMNSTDDAKLELKPLQANSELWFIKMLMKVDVQIGWLEEIVYYGS